MVVMRAAASVDDNTAPRLSCPIIRTVEILREKAGICKLLEASHAANVSGCAKARINGEQRIPHPAICGAGDDSERWVGI